MSSPLDAVVPLAGAVPGVASATAEAPHAVRVRLLPGADGAEVALAVGRLLAGTAAGAERHVLTVPQQHRPGRARIDRLDLHTDGASFSVGIALSCAGRSATASARSGTTGAGTRRAVADATLQAVTGLLAHPVHLEVDHVERSDAGAAPVVLVQVSLVSGEGVQRLAGSAVVQDGEGDAVVRATLDAVNRRVEALLAPA
ncbi:MAG: hypothetical protein JWM62_723 [Frankiales bacterium]|nr:hypothetical protein [Frankiales bacterium]